MVHGGGPLGGGEVPPGGGHLPERWVAVPPGRFVRWVESFTGRHGHVTSASSPDLLVLRAEDGAAAHCYPPFPPVPQPAGVPAGAAAGVPGQAALIAAHASAGRRVGVLLVRLGGYAAGVFEGDPPALVASKTGSRPVHGRTAAGGWSQHRFARRRENQAAAALRAAADTAAAVLGPYAAGLDAVVLGGDRRAIAGLRDDPRLRPLLEQAEERFLTVPDPRLVVLKDTPRMFRAVRIRLSGPA